MSITRVRNADFRMGRWLNGAGTSWTIATSPPGAALPNVHWQFATALIERSVPFSLLPGIDRVLTLLDGPGFTLEFADAKEIVVDCVHAPAAFPGDVAIECRVTSGVSRVLNLLFARELYRADTAVGAGPFVIPPQAEVAFIYALSGPSQLRSAGLTVELSEGDAAIIESPDAEVVCNVTGDGGQLFRAQLSRHSGP
jgi:environmental stress-induced protein Ves